jgi:hypothetical protein
METLDILLRRQQEDYVTGDNDGNRLYVAVDGGCMGAVVSLGALHQLNEEGLLARVDGFAGSSAGSLNAACAMADMTLKGRDIYTDYLPDHKFMNLGRALVSRLTGGFRSIARSPLPEFVDMNVLRSAIESELPLPNEDIISDPRELIIGISDLEEAEAVSTSSHELQGKPQSLARALLAGASLPLGLVSGYHDKDGFGALADAGLFWPTSDSIARQRNLTHVMSLASSPRPGRVGGIAQLVADVAQAQWCKLYSERGPRTTWEMAKKRNKIIGNFTLNDRQVLDGTVVERVYPDAGPLPSRQSRDKKVLNSGFNAGRQAVIRALQTSGALI